MGTTISSHKPIASTTATSTEYTSSVDVTVAMTTTKDTFNTSPSPMLPSRMSLSHIEYLESYGIKLPQIKPLEIINSDRIFYSLLLDYTAVFKGNKDLFESVIYDVQRPIDTERALEIAQTIDQKSSYHWGAIHVAYVEGYPPKLLDGQHRIFATTYMTSGRIYHAHLYISRFERESQMYDYFQEINRGVPVPIKYLTSNDALKKICDYLVNKLVQEWPGIFKILNNGSRPPYLSKSRLGEILFGILNKPENQDSRFSHLDTESTSIFYYELIMTYNNQIIDSGTIVEAQSHIQEKHFNICHRYRCYLGLVNNLDNELERYFRIHITPPIIIANSATDEIDSDDDLDDESSVHTHSSSEISEPDTTVDDAVELMIKQFRRSRFSAIISKAGAPYLPQINEDQLKTICQTIATVTLDALELSGPLIADNLAIESMDFIDRFNEWCGSRPANWTGWIKSSSVIPQFKKRFEKAQDKNFYLSLLNNCNDIYTEWLATNLE